MAREKPAPILVTVVTPALNAERYIGRTLRSVQDQGDAVVEHIVVDGGSTDGTAIVVAGYPAVKLIVADGLNQAAAVNRGVAEARGESIIVLNADDILYPGGAAALSRALEENVDAAAAYGEAIHIDDEDGHISPYPTQAFDAGTLIESCYICQPASAVRKSAYSRAGGMDPALDIALDYDFWIRLARAQRFVKIDSVVAASRMHRSNKTIARRGDVFREVISVLRRHYGYVPYTWTFAYASWLLHRKDGFFEQPAASRSAVLLALVLGLWLNPSKVLRAFTDWYRHRAAGQR